MTTATRAERGEKSSSSAVGAFLAALTGLLCLVLSCTLAYHHPLSPAWAAVSVAVLVGLGVWQPRFIWWLPPALLPLIGLAPWTGWIVFEEFDLLLLALLAGAYARLVFSNRQADAGAAAQGHKSRRRRTSVQGAFALVALTALLFAASVLISTFRGLEDAGGFSFGWFQGCHEPMNSLRLAKPFFLALLWWPLWRAAQRTSPEESNQALSLGLLLGMASVSLIALWERLAFTGLLNFSTDYRTTALFWEMHVGGAALDGFLALTVPFVLRELVLARSSRRWILAAERFSTGGKDFGGRLLHWQIGVNALEGPWDWALGKGQGRYPASHFNSGLVEDQTGDYRLRQDSNGQTHLAMSAGKHILGWGEMFRVSQRVAAPLGTTQVQFDARVKTPVTLHFEVCEKHLLYNNACLIEKIEVKAAAPGGPEWQSLSAVLDGERNPSRGSLWAPKLIMFSVGVYTNGAVAEVDNLKLLDSTGTNLLSNGDFSRDMAQWFFTSDRHHMPWHIKSMFMHVFFDQGVVGLVLWLTLTAGALWRVSCGNARHHTLSPAIAGSLLGFAVVGLFDSLLDVPRLAALYYLLVLVALVLQAPSQKDGAFR